MDLKQFEILKHMLMCQDLPSDEFAEIYSELRMECDFGQGKLIELCSGGSEMQVTKDNVGKYVSLFVEKYFQQDSL